MNSVPRIPERCPRPLLPQDFKQEDPQDRKGKNLPPINTTETYVRGDEQCKEEILTDNCTNDCIGSSQGSLIYSDFVAETSQDRLSKKLSSDHFQQLLFSASSKTNMQNKSHRRAVEYEIAYTRKKPFSCLECGKYYCSKSGLVTSVERYRPILESIGIGKEINLVTHQIIHSCNKAFSCSECGKSFKRKSTLIVHQRIHTEKYSLIRHQIIHTRQKSYSCSECGKYCNIEKFTLGRRHFRVQNVGIILQRNQNLFYI
ncbi:uncharacterized protein LOC143768149 [Ranitomeya variabilis]|uniref:uncharacterized protein LOC143768149 n=1 Tax=Ranitomeya variabilis TaxID=490064 RepID=UPI00405666D7